MKPLSHKERTEALRRMASEEIDVLVIGGGITGAGVALDAAAHGYRVALVEKGDFSSGTSSKSTKLVHGGIRYLSQFDFALTRESLIERGLLLRNAPFLVHPIGFVLPLYKGAKQPMGMPFRPPFGFGTGYLLRAGLLMYDLMSGGLGIRRHRCLSKRTVSLLAPCLKTAGLDDAFIYYDAQTEDSRLTVTVIRTAALHGALVVNHAQVTSFRVEGDKIKAACIKDNLTGKELVVRARTVVNAGGVFAGRIEEMAGRSNIEIKPAKGVHLTVSRDALKMGKHALVLPETDDGRLLFLVPWGSRVTVGTTDTEGGEIEHPEATRADIGYLLHHVNRYMRCELRESDIISAWAGYRPLISWRSSGVSSSKLSRTHAVLDGPGGMVTIVGGKLTTYRRMAQDTMDHVSHRLGKSHSRLTERLPLSGAEGWPETLEEIKEAASRFSMDADVIRRLALYGANSRAILRLISEEPALASRIVPGLPYIMAEVIYACRFEMAMELGDVLERRLRINFEDWSRGTEAAPRVAECMFPELGWDAAETARQVERYCRMVAGSR